MQLLSADSQVQGPVLLKENFSTASLTNDGRKSQFLKLFNVAPISATLAILKIFPFVIHKSTSLLVSFQLPVL